MLYIIHYYKNKEKKEIINENLKNNGKTSVPFGQIGIYFADKNLAKEIADELTKSHSDDGLEYAVLELEHYNINDINKNLIMNSRKDYENHLNKKDEKIYINERFEV